MRSFPVTFFSAAMAVIFSGCLASPVGSSGGIGTVTIENSNTWAIESAAREVFREYGYTLASSNLPDSISFDKAGGGFQNLMWGSYDQTTTVRVRLTIDPIGAGGNYRVSPQLRAVNDAGEAGFESSHPITSLWATEFIPIMKQIKARASNAD